MEAINGRLKALEKEIESLKGILKIEDKRKTISSLQQKMSEPLFWQEQNKASSVLRELKALKNDVDDWDILHKKLAEIKDLAGISDSSYAQELQNELDKLHADCEKLKLRILFSERFDSANAILEINAGAGGTESCDWVNMLFRMYFRWAEDKGFKLSVIDEVRGEEAGIKNITFLIEGLRAYGLLKAERGVHRLVRISPFDANKRRHTSFASVDVLPQIEGEVEIELKSEELKIETFRASGHGGQHVQKTESAVRITHLPTGLVASCQSERSQYQNKQVALSVLEAKLYERKEDQRKRELEKLSGSKRKIEWGSQIRSYVLYPYLLVKDHRTDLESPDAWGVLDGKLDDFIYAYLKYSKC